MSSAITARGMTAIYDGIMSGLSRLERARHTRQVLIVVSDGGDNASKATLDETLKRVHDSDATIYTVALIDPLMQRTAIRGCCGASRDRPAARRISRAASRMCRRRSSASRKTFATPTRSPTRRRRAAAARPQRRRTVKVYVRSQDGRVAARCGHATATSRRRTRIGNEGARDLARASRSSGCCLASASAASACMPTRPSRRAVSRPSRRRRSSATRKRAAGAGACARGGLVGMLDVPRLQLSTPVIEGDDTAR